MPNGGKVGPMRAVLFEIRMLIDFIAGNTSKSVADVKIADPEQVEAKTLPFQCSYWAP